MANIALGGDEARAALGAWDELKVVGELDVLPIFSDDPGGSDRDDVLGLSLGELQVVSAGADDARVADYSTLAHQLSHWEGSDRSGGNVKSSLSTSQLSVGSRTGDNARRSDQHDIVRELMRELSVDTVRTDDP